MRRLLIICSILASVPLYAQRPVTQCGRVRSICYSRLGKVQPISNVIVKPYLQPEQRSDQNGNFCISVVPDKNGMFRYESIKSLGYTLISPNNEELSRESFVANNKETKEIIMVKDGDLYAERRRISNNIRKEKEKEIAHLQEMIYEKDAQLKKYLQEKKDVADLKAIISDLEKKYNELQMNYEQATKQIEDEADRLARIDYLNIDSINAHSYDLQKAGLWNDAVHYNKGFVNEKRIKQTAILYESAIKRINFEAERCVHIANSYAQGYERDSAMYWLEQRVILDPNNVDYLFDAGKYALWGIDNVTLSEQYLKRALKCSEETYGKNDIRTINCLTMLGNVSKNQLDYKKSIEYNEEALSRIDADNNPEGANTIINNLGLSYLATDFNIALQYFKRSLDYHQKSSVENELHISDDMNNIATAYMGLGKYELAITYFRESISLLEKSRYINIDVLGNRYYNLGATYYNHNRFQNAVESLLKAMSFQVKSKSPQICDTYDCLALSYIKMKDFEKGKEFCQKALEEAKIRNNQLLIAKAYYEMGYIANLNKEYLTAKKMYNEAIDTMLLIRDKVYYNILYDCMATQTEMFMRHGGDEVMAGIKYYQNIISQLPTIETLEVNKLGIEIFCLMNLAYLNYTEKIRNNNSKKYKEYRNMVFEAIDKWDIGNNMKSLYKNELTNRLRTIKYWGW